MSAAAAPADAGDRDISERLDTLAGSILDLRRMASIASVLVDHQLNRTPDGDLCKKLGDEALQMVFTTWELEDLVFATNHVAQMAHDLDGEIQRLLIEARSGGARVRPVKAVAS